MMWILVYVLLLPILPASLSQGQSQSQNAPYTMPPKPDNQSQQPPTASPKDQDQSMANQDIESQLDNAFSNDPSLDGADVQASVDDQNITLTGTVESEGQRQRVLALCQAYARYRNIVDKMVTK